MTGKISLFVFLFVQIFSGAVGQVPLDDTTFWESSEVDVYSTGLIWEDCNNDRSYA